MFNTEKEDLKDISADTGRDKEISYFRKRFISQGLRDCVSNKIMEKQCSKFAVMNYKKS